MGSPGGMAKQMYKREVGGESDVKVQAGLCNLSNFYQSYFLL